jgi:hypothetical protein
VGSHEDFRAQKSRSGAKIPLESKCFVAQSITMNSNLAEEHLQTIRLLMERAALYRRALAPIMLVAGGLGLLAAAAGWFYRIESPRAFAGLWLGTACLVITATFLLARRQALKDQEPFWSPPTYRVGQALLPPLISGLILGGSMGLLDTSWAVDLPMALVWILFYGCALNSAGFFMARGIKWLGWMFILGMPVLLFTAHLTRWSITPASANIVMGLFFGGLHLAYGIYLHFTEKQPALA